MEFNVFDMSDMCILNTIVSIINIKLYFHGYGSGKATKRNRGYSYPDNLTALKDLI